MFRPLYAALAIALALPAHADQASIAVAANFSAPMKALQPLFEKATGHVMVLSSGATGKFYAQIKNGAPFDVLLAADAETPKRLQREGAALRTQTYAIGKLALWSADPRTLDGSDAVLKANQFKHVAIANPRLAPYGTAAMQVLAKLGLNEAVRDKQVMGENIGQTHQYVASGNAEIGFVALSQIMLDGKLTSGSVWLIPSRYYTPIRQDAALLKHGAGNPAAQALLDFLRTPAAQKLIRGYGYGYDR
ncbi:MAG TPA: molybdate ABC transporter substrate-binding protein [Thiobacillus sp.]|uniref:molybdate ABC transporter substrate-binding protein n=1 Tax=Acidovorax sp. TaxID=1872122 RepID=UPI000BD9E66E|nr:molybdate ABC transporter substrate-binding protein [Acidovorax sp.]OYY62651.1 MAG: molybdate ABC transporter substrate-binding protein [Hydrogenophilales bacterium 28-61-11]OYZ58374.1 MAG: molybdate ABC transporter substrate-binding protein [Hydrogenophilales bacterium 16-61-112]OZA45365.1 MAG: molybdate ABC transporter substrate-binding protein [Hydrogenophilales bacterium 17-61-76]HQT30597.1 molybdate ABC transporter substrate-binding protein [Thiobacillus sp.]HQT69971.1 molybdate ABC tr